MSNDSALIQIHNTNQCYFIISASIWAKAGILLIRPLGTTFSEISIENFDIFIQENAFGIVVGKMVAILPRPQCVNQK